MFRIEKYLGSLRVSRKLAAAFTLVIGLMAAASVTNLAATRSYLPELRRMVSVEANLAGEGADARAVLLELRGDEKDILLHVDDAAQVAAAEKEWDEHYAEQIGTLDGLDKTAITAADHEALATIRKVQVAYGEAVKKQLAAIHTGKITTTAAATAAIASISESADQLDETITKWYESHERLLADLGTAIEHAMARALLFTFVMTVGALALSFAIAY